MASDWTSPSEDVDAALLEAKIKALREEHRALDQALQALQETAPYDQIGLMRLKRRKLALKDEIAHWEDQLTPDIIA
ncbi:hypothetical protein PbB2_01309 [Candidatus Phycosocius bacilliformis]|uniref:DUF465 domain-containing protein n=1 Tax=Candidatus Phycosocius bacilliformis TaxID=1445552 RepID=A0A2P2E997_9PROT|nr:DUF465 domain-containing protein [Candidatus Phycosocius bacilliformis]GBF57640.1 hypothetical protein PbB2_01309 [Candidatus Phycosocius bacilliformis]